MPAEAATLGEPDLEAASEFMPGANRLRAWTRSMQTLVAMRYSQARTYWPSNVARLRQARRNVSCTASSASSKEASIR